jgi:hypothetical protein
MSRRMVMTTDRPRVDDDATFAGNTNADRGN